MLAKLDILFILAHRSEDDVRKYTFSQTYWWWHVVVMIPNHCFIWIFEKCLFLGSGHSTEAEKENFEKQELREQLQGEEGWGDPDPGEREGERGGGDHKDGGREWDDTEGYWTDEEEVQTARTVCKGAESWAYPVINFHINIGVGVYSSNWSNEHNDNFSFIYN